MEFETRALPETCDDIAPDRSEIRLLSQTSRCSLVHARLQAGMTALPVVHRSVDEVWYCLGGRGQLWRRLGAVDEVVHLAAGVSATIPQGTAFQWRNTGTDRLDVLISTVPPWPGATEAAQTDGPWTA